jgi:hypothetical protein
MVLVAEPKRPVLEGEWCLWWNTYSIPVELQTPLDTPEYAEGRLQVSVLHKI